MMSKQKTRASVSHSVFGRPLMDLPKTELPTRGQIARHVLFVKERKNASNSDAFPIVLETVTSLWKRAGIPTEPAKNINIKLKRLMEQGSKQSQYRTLSGKGQLFVDSLDKLFDIAGCQCQDFLKCSCDKDIKVPQKERDFLTDQRTGRQMQIGSLDSRSTRIMMRREKQEQRLHDRQLDEKRRKMESEKVVTVQTSCSSSSEKSDIYSGDEIVADDFVMSECSGDTGEASRNMIEIPTVALEADRYGVSNSCCSY